MGLLHLNADLDLQERRGGAAGAGAVLIIALGRVGLYNYSAMTGVAPPLWGWLMLALAVALYGTAWQRCHWVARTIAGIGAGILGGMAIDVWPYHTSALLLALLSYVLIGEAATDDC